MKKDKISASEVNRYIYCNYQWYYEKVYGKEHIRKLYKERNEKLGLTDNSKSNFVKGLNFHNNFRLKKKSSLVNVLIFIIIMFIIVFLYYYFDLKEILNYFLQLFKNGMEQ